MLITGKKRPFRFVLKQQKPLNRGKNGVFHIKTFDNFQKYKTELNKNTKQNLTIDVSGF